MKLGRLLQSLWIAIIILALLVHCEHRGCQRSEVKLPTLGQVPAFNLVAQDGHAFSQHKLKGKVWVANFVFTRCPTICPVLTRSLASVQTQFTDEASDVHFMSFSVDPKHDSPQDLKAFAKEHQVNLSNWTFVTGEYNALRDAIVKGFKLSMGEPVALEGGGYNILHATHFVLVDQHGKIRGYYRHEPDALKKLSQAMRSLLARPPRPAHNPSS